MARPNWEYIRIDVRLPRHRKLDGARRDVKWTLVELLAYCGEELTDGFVRDAVWKTIGTPVMRQQIIDRGFAARVRGGYQMHDYLEHQRSRAEVEELRAKRSAAGVRSGQARAKARANVQALAEHPVEQNANKTRTEAEAEAEAEVNPPVAEEINSNVEVTPPPAVKLPEGKWMADENGTALPPDRPGLEAERRRQMDALMRQYPEISTP